MASEFVRWIGQKEFNALPATERTVLIAAFFADQEHVRESGFNRGFWVEKFLSSVGLGPGYAWCAAFTYHCLTAAKWPADLLPQKRKAAAVVHWHKWASDRKLLTNFPRRGDLFLWLNADGTGHIGFITKVEGRDFLSVEGNTNENGSREGDGVYRKRRRMDGKIEFISLERASKLIRA